MLFRSPQNPKTPPFLEEVNALAKRMETQQGFFAMIMAAEKNKASLPAADSLTYFITAARAIPAQPYQEKAIAKTLIDRQPVAGKIVQESKDEKLGTTQLTLSNGISVTLKPTDFKSRFTCPLAQ